MELFTSLGYQKYRKGVTGFGRKYSYTFNTATILFRGNRSNLLDLLVDVQFEDFKWSQNETAPKPRTPVRKIQTGSYKFDGGFIRVTLFRTRDKHFEGIERNFEHTLSSVIKMVEDIPSSKTIGRFREDHGTTKGGETIHSELRFKEKRV